MPAGHRGNPWLRTFLSGSNAFSMQSDSFPCLGPSHSSAFSCMFLLHIQCQSNQTKSLLIQQSYQRQTQPVSLLADPHYVRSFPGGCGDTDDLDIFAKGSTSQLMTVRQDAPFCPVGKWIVNLITKRDKGVLTASMTPKSDPSPSKRGQVVNRFMASGGRSWC